METWHKLIVAGIALFFVGVIFITSVGFMGGGEIALVGILISIIGVIIFLIGIWIPLKRLRDKKEV